jgi:hypothetical protein
VRVGGDVMDMAALARSVQKDNPRRKIAMFALATVAAIAVVDVIMATQATIDKRDNAEAAA